MKVQSMPVRSFRKLWHVGTMDILLKRRGSHEGTGLSVSTEPEAWKQINKGHTAGPTWELTKAGNQFLNMHSLSARSRKRIADWGIAHRLVKASALYRYEYRDDELDDTVYSDFPTRIEAENEASAPEEVTEVQGLIATSKLLLRVSEDSLSPVMVPDFLATLFAEQELKIDGVWWQDILDPLAYSAPRGVIFKLHVQHVEQSPGRAARPRWVAAATCTYNPTCILLNHSCNP
jgi:hypothetical protein